MKKDKFDDYIDTPHFASMDEVEKLIQPAWDSLREEAKRRLACNIDPEDTDNEKVSYHHTVKIIRGMIEDAEADLRRSRTEQEAKVHYAMLRRLLDWRDEVEDALHDTGIITSMMYQELGNRYAWMK